MRTETEIRDKIAELGGLEDIPGRAPAGPFVMIEMSERAPEDPIGDKRLTLNSILDALPSTEETLNLMLKNALDFGLLKAHNHRGISSNVVAQRVETLLWVLGDEEAEAFAANPENYPMYGMPIYKHVARKYGWELPTWAEAWADGAPCYPGCKEGCNT